VVYSTIIATAVTTITITITIIIDMTERSYKNVVNSIPEILKMMGSRCKKNIVETITLEGHGTVDESKAKELILSMFWRDYSPIYNALKIIIRIEAYCVYDIILQYIYGNSMVVKSSYPRNRKVSLIHSVPRYSQGTWYQNNHFVSKYDNVGPINLLAITKMLRNSPIKKKIYTDLTHFESRHIWGCY